MGFFTLRKAIILALILGVFSILDANVSRFFIFDQNRLHQIAKESINKKLNTSHEMFIDLVANLNKAYPGHIRVKEQWVFNIAGGAMGHFWLLHGSITEYLIIFGTPIGTEGHTGRFMADDYFIILAGEQWAYSQDDIERQRWLPGEMHHLKRGDSQGYKIPEYGYALEYARGWIPLMLPFGLADILSSNLDYHTFFRTFYLYAVAVIPELLMGKF